jgi:hypothetical protein
MKLKTNILFIVFILFAISAYSQIDSLENRKIYGWKLDPNDLSLQLQELDTNLSAFQNFNPLLKNTISSNYLGNLGTAAQSKIYYDRKLFETGFIFSEPYGIYFHLPKEQIYFNTKRQFTLINFSNAGPKEESEQVLNLLHSQNINKDFNFGFDYDLISSDGRYQNQAVKQNKITLFSSYQKKGYRLHTNFGLNRIKAQENGGIDSLQYLGSDEYKNRKNIPVRLEDARAQVFNTNLYLAHEYRFGKTIEEVKLVKKEEKGGKGKKGIPPGELKKGAQPVHIIDSTLNKEDTTGLNEGYFVNQDTITSDSIQIRVDLDKTEEVAVKMDTVKVFMVNGFSLSHEMIYNSDVRKYFDDNISEPFYNNMDIYIDSLKTHDEVKQKQFGNKLSIHYQYFDKFSTRLSFYDEQMNYKFNIRPDTTFSDTLINPIQDTIVKSNVEEKESNGNVSFYINAVLLKHILFSGYGEYFIYGYKKENSKLDFKFAYLLGKNSEISLEGKYSNSKPDYFYKNFTSNNFKWENNYLRNIEEWDAAFIIRNEKYKIVAKVRYGQITNHLYLDSTAYVNQFRGQINITSAELSKRLKLGPINSVTRFVYQKSTQDSILNLPEYNLYQSLYYERLSNFPATGGKMLWQVGIDYRLTSSYMADGYMPTTGLFYRQFNHEQVNYHCFDLFVNIKIKRARFYFKYHYLNSAINKNYYFTGPYYPSPEPLFKFGLAWTFYD